MPILASSKSYIDSFHARLEFALNGWVWFLLVCCYPSITYSDDVLLKLEGLDNATDNNTCSAECHLNVTGTFFWNH